MYKNIHINCQSIDFYSNGIALTFLTDGMVESAFDNNIGNVSL